MVVHTAVEGGVVVEEVVAARIVHSELEVLLQSLIYTNEMPW